MKKLVLNINDSFYEKLRFESLSEKKSIQEIIVERLNTKSFSEEVEEAYNSWMLQEIEKINQE